MSGTDFDTDWIDPTSLPVSTATQTALDAKQNALTGLTASVSELNYVDWVTSPIQTQLDSKQWDLTLTTTGTSGAATLIGDTLNIPQYSGGGGVTDHGALTWLADDDHTQYTKADWTRAFTGKQSYSTHPTFSTDTELVDKKYVDDSIIAGGGYTDEQAQDAVGTILVDSSTIDFTYSDATPSITGGVIDGSIGTVKLGGDITAAGKALLDDANASAQRTTLWLNTTANQTDSTNKRFMTDAQETKLDGITGTNTGDQTSIVGITGTTAEFNTAITDGDMATLAGTETLTNKTLTSPTLITPLLGTPFSGNLSNCGALPVAGITGDTTTALWVGSINIWHASDTTITRVSAWVIAVEWGIVPTVSSINMILNKRQIPRFLSAASYTTDTWTSLDFSTCDLFIVTAQAWPLKFNNPSGTPAHGEKIMIRIKDNGTARALTYDTQYRAIGVTLPTTTVIWKTTYLGGIWNSTDTKLDIIAVAQEA